MVALAAWVPRPALAQRPAGGGASTSAAAEMERVALALGELRAELGRLEARVATAHAFAARPAPARVVVLLRVDSTAAGSVESASAAVDDGAGVVHRYDAGTRAALRAGGSDELYQAVLGPGARTVQATVTVGGVPTTRTLVVTAPPDGGVTVVEIAVRSGGVEAGVLPAGDATDDADVRTALFALAVGDPAGALARLTDASRRAGPRGAGDAGRSLALRVLTVEAQARLGDDQALERVAVGLLEDPGARPLARALRTRLVMSALARGDDAAALRLATADPRAADDGALALLAGLAQLRAGAVADARASFTRARRAGGATAPYAAYSDAVAAVRSDSTAAPAALDSLVALAAQADPVIAGRAAVTAAQLAYELGRYPQAALVAGAVRSPAALGDALLVRGWALYREGAMAGAIAALDEHARVAPARPTRAEAELLAAQALLVGGRTSEAGRRFRSAAEAATAALAELERGGAELVAASAAALLDRGAAGDLWHTGDGLTLDLPPAGALFDAATLAAVVRGSAFAAAAPLWIVSAPREDAADAPRESVSQARLRLARPDPARAAAVRRELAPALGRVAAARAAARTAHAATERDDSARRAAVATLAAARRELGADRQQLAALGSRLAGSAATLRRAAAGGGTRSTPGGRAPDREAAAGERARADSLAPVVAELRARLGTAAGLAGEADRRLAAATAGAPSTAASGQPQAAAEAERAAAEGALAAAVARELERRRAVAIVGLRRDIEAAEFAAAASAFFAASGGGVPRPVEVVRPTRRPAAMARPAP